MPSWYDTLVTIMYVLWASALIALIYMIVTDD